MIHVALRNGSSVFLYHNLILSDLVIGKYNSIWVGVGIRKLDISRTQSLYQVEVHLRAQHRFQKTLLTANELPICFV